MKHYWINVHEIVGVDGRREQVHRSSTGPYTSRTEAERGLTGLLAAGRVVSATITTTEVEDEAEAD